MDDAERRRWTELLDGLDKAGEPERTEVELYLEQYPHLREAFERRCQEMELGSDWLSRVRADRGLQRRERSRLVRIERGVGLGLLGAGTLLSPVLGVVAPVAVLSGMGLLVWSFVRLRLQEIKEDPYRRIDQ